MLNNKNIMKTLLFGFIIPLVSGEIYNYFFKIDSVKPEDFLDIEQHVVDSTTIDNLLDSNTFLELYNSKSEEINYTLFEVVKNFFFTCYTEIYSYNVLPLLLDKPLVQLILNLGLFFTVIPVIFFITQPNIISFLPRMILDPFTAINAVCDMSFSFFILPIIDILGCGLVHFLAKISAQYAGYNFYLKFLYGVRYLSLWVFGYSYICFLLISFVSLI
jgi:hypothetical protein